MEELSLHILDLVQNSLGAGATWVKVVIVEDLAQDIFSLEIHDNGRGMDKKFLQRIFDPFATTRTTRRVGLGLSLLHMAAQQCNGKVEVDSIPGRGTKVSAVFQHSHWDRAPLGNIVATLITIISGNPELTLRIHA
ncbi:MAG: ATP-binding protein [bacterium]